MLTRFGWGKRHLIRPRRRWEYDIKLDLDGLISEY